MIRNPRIPSLYHRIQLSVQKRKPKIKNTVNYFSKAL